GAGWCQSGGLSTTRITRGTNSSATCHLPMLLSAAWTTRVTACAGVIRPAATSRPVSATTCSTKAPWVSQSPSTCSRCATEHPWLSSLLGTCVSPPPMTTVGAESRGHAVTVAVAARVKTPSPYETVTTSPGCTPSSATATSARKVCSVSAVCETAETEQTFRAEVAVA